MHARKVSNMEYGDRMFLICTVLECGRIYYSPVSVRFDAPLSA